MNTYLQNKHNIRKLCMIQRALIYCGITLFTTYFDITCVYIVDMRLAVNWLWSWRHGCGPSSIYLYVWSEYVMASACTGDGKVLALRCVVHAGS